MPLLLGCILLYTRVCRKLVRVMAIFWTSWLVAMNMISFIIMLHNQFQLAERMRETSCLCAKTVAAVSRLVLLSAGLFTPQDASNLAVLFALTVDQDASNLAVIFALTADQDASNLPVYLVRLSTVPAPQPEATLCPLGSFSLLFALATSV